MFVYKQDLKGCICFPFQPSTSWVIKDEVDRQRAVGTRFNNNGILNYVSGWDTEKAITNIPNAGLMSSNKCWIEGHTEERSSNWTY